MNPLKGLIGLIIILAIGLVAFYSYSNLSKKDPGQAAETASIVDFINNKDGVIGVSDDVVARAHPTTSRPSLEGFKEEELLENLDNIKAGLDLLQNPIE